MQEEGKYNILYVDDEEDNLLVFRSAFRRLFNIYTATSGDEGIEILKTTPIGVIITDQRMPGMTGVQFVKTIPDEPENIKMILTGFSDVSAIIEAINTGKVYRYVAKPWNRDELKEIIDQAVKALEIRMESRKTIEILSKRCSDLEIQVEELTAKLNA